MAHSFLLLIYSHISTLLDLQIYTSEGIMSLQIALNLYMLISASYFVSLWMEAAPTGEEYFAQLLILSMDPRVLLLMYNCTLSLYMVCYKLFLRLFFVQAKENEVVKTIDKLKLKLMDLAFFIYLNDFQISFNFQVYAIVLFLVFMLVLHSMATFRSEYLVQTPTVAELGLNFRLLSLFLILLFVDYQLLKHFLELFFSGDIVSVMFIYYLYSITMSIVEPFMMFAVDLYEKYTFRHIQNADAFLAFVSVSTNTSRLVIQILMAAWISYEFSSLFFFVLTFVENAGELRRTIKKFVSINILTSNMGKLQLLTQNDLMGHDTTCLVCLEQMTQARRLPCGHIFHEDCLRQWIIRNSNRFCPRCKKELDFANLRNQPHEHQPHQPHEHQPHEHQPHEPHEQHEQRRPVQEHQRMDEEQVTLAIRRTVDQETGTQQEATQSRHIPVGTDRLKPVQQDHLQGYRQMEQAVRRANRVGSLAYGVPSQAVYFRKKRDMRQRAYYQQGSAQILQLLAMGKPQQMVIIGK